MAGADGRGHQILLVDVAVVVRVQAANSLPMKSIHSFLKILPS